MREKATSVPGTRHEGFSGPWGPNDNPKMLLSWVFLATVFRWLESTPIRHTEITNSRWILPSKTWAASMGAILDVVLLLPMWQSSCPARWKIWTGGPTARDATPIDAPHGSLTAENDSRDSRSTAHMTKIDSDFDFEIQHAIIVGSPLP